MDIPPAPRFTVTPAVSNAFRVSPQRRGFDQSDARSDQVPAVLLVSSLTLVTQPRLVCPGTKESGSRLVSAAACVKRANGTVAPRFRLEERKERRPYCKGERASVYCKLRHLARYPHIVAPVKFILLSSFTCTSSVYLFPSLFSIHSF